MNWLSYPRSFRGSRSETGIHCEAGHADRWIPGLRPRWRIPSQPLQVDTHLMVPAIPRLAMQMVLAPRADVEQTNRNRPLGKSRDIGGSYASISKQYLSRPVTQSTTSARRTCRLSAAQCSPSGSMKNKKGSLKMLKSRIGLALASALVVGSSLIAIAPASAAEGCGPGWWRGPWGHCRDTPYTGPLPRGGYQIEFRPADNGCPPGFWRGPYGHCRNTPFHGRLPNGNWK